MMKKTRILSLAMATAMMCTGVGSIAMAEPEENTLPISDGSVQLSFYMAMESGSEQKMTTYDEHPAIITLEERTGVDITFVHPPAGDDGTFFNTIVASGDYPDVWITTGFKDYYPGGIAQAIEDGILANPNELIDQYGWYFTQESSTWDESTVRNMKTDDGTWRLGAASQRVPVLDQQHSGLVTRGDVMAELGIEDPTTVEEFTDMLRKFKEAGFETPMALHKLNWYYSSGNFLNWQYGCMTDGFQLEEDGKTVTYSRLVPGYKDFLTQMNAWLNEGLIDRDFVNRTDDDAQKMFTSGQSAVCWSGNWETKEQIQLGQVEDPNFDVHGLPSFALDAASVGTTNHYGDPIVNGTSGQSWSISATSSHQKEAMKVLDYLYSHDGIELMVFGPTEWEGETIHVTNEDGTRTFSDYILNNPTLAYNTIRYQYTIQSLSSEYASDMESQQYNAPVNAQCWEAWTSNLDNAYRVPSTISMTAEESTEYVNTMNTINTFINDKIYKIITGDEPVDNWDGYVQQLHDYGIDRCIEITQAAYDRYLAR